MGMVVQWDAVSADEFEGLRHLDEDALVDWLEDYESRASFDIDKAWHAAHFVLTGSAEDTSGPLGTVVLGGTEFGHELGYGLPRWVTPAQVVESAAALAALSTDDVHRRIDFAAMTAHHIYPSIWDRDPVGEQLVEFILDGIEQLRTGFAAAAAAGQGFVVSML